LFPKFRCMESLTVYGAEGRNREEMVECGGDEEGPGRSLLFYYPEQRPVELRP